LTRGERGFCCSHGFRETDDWHDGDCGFYSGFSSDCVDCLGIRLASDACASAIAEYHEMVGATVGVRLWVSYGRRVRVHLAVGPDGQDPPDPYGSTSADCFYEKPPEGEDYVGTRRLAGGLSFALPDEVHGAAKHGGPPPEPARKRKAAALEEPEPDWAPYTAVAAKPSEFYANYDARAHVGFTLMKHNALADPTELYRWLEDPKPGARPASPPAGLPLPPVDPEPLELPPKRAEFANGRRGRRVFHRERATWYMQATGTALEGTLEEQNALFDKVARRYRAYSDYRAHRSVARFAHESAHGPAVVGMGPLPEHLTATASERRGFRHVGER